MLLRINLADRLTSFTIKSNAIIPSNQKSNGGHILAAITTSATEIVN